MNALVVGTNGLLGSNVLVECLDRGYDPVGTYHTAPPDIDAPCHHLDIRDMDALSELLSEQDPNVVLNCAAMTDVDECESEPKLAQAINGTAPGTIAAACAERDINCLHVSTDYVFDGFDGAPYGEDARPNPIQVYGETKLAGERAVSENHPNPTIARLSFVYGIHRGEDTLTGFPAWVRDTLDSGDDVPLFTDQKVTPTRAGQAAATLLDLYETGQTGTYHLACRSCVSPYEFGRYICEVMGVTEQRLNEGELTDIDRPARRPKASCLSVDAVEGVLGRPQPTLSEDLDEISSAF